MPHTRKPSFGHPNESTPLLSSGNTSAELNNIYNIGYNRRYSDNDNELSSSPRAASVFSGSLASGINDAYELEVNIDTLLVMKTGKCTLIPHEPQQSRRLLGIYSTVILFVARMVGSGIFATPGVIFNETNSSPLLFGLIWGAGALVGYSGLAVYLELGSYLPVSGATKVFLEFIFPKPSYYWTVVFGFFTIFFTYCSTNAVIFGQYIRYSLGYIDDEAESKKIAIMLIIFGFLAHGCSKKFGIICQNIIGTMKLMVLGILLITSIWILIVPSSITRVNKEGLLNYSLSNDLKSLPKNITSVPLSILASAILKSIYSFGGWTTAHTVQNEIKDPIKTLKKAAVLSFLSIFVLYGAIILTYFAVIPHDKIAANGKLVGVLLFQKVFGDILGRRILSFVISLSAASNVLIVIFSDSRLYQEISREGFIPFHKTIAKNYTSSQTPTAALFLHCLISCLILLAPISKDMYSFIVSMTIYPNQLFHAILCFGIFKLRHRFKYIIAPLRASTALVIICLSGSLMIVMAPIIDVFFGNNKKRFKNAAFTFGSIGALFIASLYWFLVVKVVPFLSRKQLQRSVEILDDGLKIKFVQYVE